MNDNNDDVGLMDIRINFLRCENSNDSSSVATSTDPGILLLSYEGPKGEGTGLEVTRRGADEDEDDDEVNVPFVSEMCYVFCVNRFVPWLCSPRASRCPSSRGGAIVLER